jgi:hypothetical protein
MTLHRPWRRHALLSVLVLGTTLAQGALAVAANQLSGYVYIDRNGDGQLAFNNDPNPEWVIPGVEIKLFSVNNSVETLEATTLTDNVGRFEFGNILAGLYTLRETQPVQYVDGADTAGTMRNLLGPTVPAGNSPGTAGNDEFRNILFASSTSSISGENYFFGERGVAPAFVSKRFLLDTAPAPVYAPQIPEPSGALLAFIAVAGGGMLRRRKRTGTLA